MYLFETHILKNKSCQELLPVLCITVKRQIPSSSTGRRCRLIITYTETLTILKYEF